MCIIHCNSYRNIKRFFIRHLFPCLQRLASLKSAEYSTGWRPRRAKAPMPVQKLAGCRPKKAKVPVQVKRPSAENPLWLGNRSVVLFRPSTDWIVPPHTRDGSLLHSKSTNLNINPIQKYPHKKHPE